jgi:hypothetical protein
MIETVPQSSAPESAPVPLILDSFPVVLMQSRQRWQRLVGLAVDLAFETDADGRFVFIAPETALVGPWPAHRRVVGFASARATAPAPFLIRSKQLRRYCDGVPGFDASMAGCR